MHYVYKRCAAGRQRRGRKAPLARPPREHRSAARFLPGGDRRSGGLRCASPRSAPSNPSPATPLSGRENAAGQRPNPQAHRSQHGSPAGGTREVLAGCDARIPARRPSTSRPPLSWEEKNRPASAPARRVGRPSSAHGSVRKSWWWPAHPGLAPALKKASILLSAASATLLPPMTKRRHLKPLAWKLAVDGAARRRGSTASRTRCHPAAMKSAFEATRKLYCKIKFDDEIIKSLSMRETH